MVMALLNFRPLLILTLVTSLYLLTIPPQAIALGTPPSLSSMEEDSKQPQSVTVPLFVHVVNANSGTPISGAFVWLDGVYAGSADWFGNVGYSVTHPPFDHSYLVSARGYQVEKGTFTIESNGVGRFTVQLTPNDSHQ